MFVWKTEEIGDITFVNLDNVSMIRVYLYKKINHIYFKLINGTEVDWEVTPDVAFAIKTRLKDTNNMKGDLTDENV